MTKRLSTALIFTLATLTLFAQTERLQPKHLAGPASDFLTGVMKRQTPDEIGVRSRSAMLPVTFDARGQWQAPVGIMDGANFQLLTLSGEETWSVSLQAPGMKRPLDASETAMEARFDEYGIGEERFPSMLYRFDNLAEGEWTLHVKREGMIRAKANTNLPDGFIMISDESTYRLYSHLNTEDLWVGSDIGFLSYGYDADLFGPIAKPGLTAGLVAQATLRVTTPAGDVLHFDMFDDGQHNDGLAGDGVFGALFQPREPGQYNAQIVARGETPEGRPFVRTTEHSFPVILTDLAINTDLVQTRIVDENRVTMTLPVDRFDGPTHYRAYAEVWAHDAKGDLQPAAWIGGMTYVDGGAVELNFDTRWLALSGLQAPLELRNLRLEDVDGYVPAARVDRLGVYGSLPAAARRPLKAVTDDMRMGVRPERHLERSNKAGVLMMVHGYCSGDAWGPYMGQFSSAVKFQDFNKNRSHDDFAQRIGSFGGAYSSFGVVAHSQGGAASLHLYTYYWSGLDNAGSGRLIQSVGTPYQGTALAGNLAALGDVFGVGCGINNDLTYNGASSWLSGIPSWARSKVNYYTTAFKDRWWAYDYCNIATDLFLSDPEDGTTEKSKGQLSGAANRGHKSGWCHTTGMRDPAQVSDSSRNSTMNANAAR